MSTDNKMEEAKKATLDLLKRAGIGIQARMYRHIANESVRAAQNETVRKHWEGVLEIADAVEDSTVAEEFMSFVRTALDNPNVDMKMKKDFMVDLSRGVIEISRHS